MQLNSRKKQDSKKTYIKEVCCKLVEWRRIWESIDTCTETCWRVEHISRIRIRESQSILGERESSLRVRYDELVQNRKQKFKVNFCTAV